MANVISICGSLRKGSYNRMVMNLLPGLAPSAMAITEAPSFAEFPLYNADIQTSTGFPAPVNMLADAIRAADGVVGLRWSISSRRILPIFRWSLRAPASATSPFRCRTAAAIRCGKLPGADPRELPRGACGPAISTTPVAKSTRSR